MKKPASMSELNGYVPKDLKRDFKILCAAQERSMSEVLTELIQGWIEANKSLAHDTGVRSTENKG